ncbi:MAG: alpha-1,2-fucosyltransferase [Proteobacteria bacterium]|nr:alpha-1,2-fucosyltransferase [Pseudomonadota bacterium]
MPPHKIIVRIKGGLGNQLFCYAAARRLSLVNDAELVIDDVTGFIRDRLYCRRYMLDCFNIPARKATKSERLEPFERYRRGVMKWLSRSKPFAEKRYLEQDGLDFDGRLLELKVKGPLYIDGLWQSDGYFKDVEQTIREDLRIIPPTDGLNQRMAEKIRSSNAVALHVRWFDATESETSFHNVSGAYYQRAIAEIQRYVKKPHYFLFSDDPAAAKRLLDITDERVAYVDHNRGDENGCSDLWLMTQCRHFITANSTFSWWGAWLGGGNNSIIIAPNIKLRGGITSWGFNGQIPERWIRI